VHVASAASSCARAWIKPSAASCARPACFVRLCPAPALLLLAVQLAARVGDNEDQPKGRDDDESCYDTNIVRSLILAWLGLYY
jgi:hypothetical protein